MSEYIVEMRNITKRFPGIVANDNVTIQIKKGEIYALLGENGAGKSTLMSMLFGMYEPDEGEIYVDGEKVTYGQTPTNRHIGYLPDVPEFYSFMTAPEYLHFCGQITGMKASEIESRTKELLELVGLGNEKHRIKGFSRGMKQRLGIAQALLNRPKLLICDEPTSALDPVGRKEILDILLAAREQTTVLFSTHILSDVERICSDIAFLHGGKTVIQGKLADIKATYRSEEYLLETEKEADAAALQKTFPAMRRTDHQLIFSEKDYELFDILKAVTHGRISILKVERMEPTLENLFMEVVEK